MFKSNSKWNGDSELQIDQQREEKFFKVISTNLYLSLKKMDEKPEEKVWIVFQLHAIIFH